MTDAQRKHCQFLRLLRRTAVVDEVANSVTKIHQRVEGIAKAAEIELTATEMFEAETFYAVWNGIGAE